MHRRFSLLVCAAAIVALAAGAFAQAPKAKPAAKAQGNAATAKPGTYAHFETSMGNFTVRLWPDKAPQTVANFVGLAEGTVDTITGRQGVKSKPFYNGLQFHRVKPGFMIQGGGIERGDRFVGAGYTIPDEFDPKFSFNRAGIIAMANTGQPHSASSQFFVTVAPHPSLNGKYTPFGEVMAGLDVVKKIATVKRDPSNDRPLEPVVIRTVRIEKIQ
jgi:cyclophilin family peptidyl-prolyl cis-trans isomerase